MSLSGHTAHAQKAVTLWYKKVNVILVQYSTFSYFAWLTGIGHVKINILQPYGMYVVHLLIFRYMIIGSSSGQLYESHESY